MNQNKDTGWKGRTRGGSFGYLFFIFLIKRLGVRVAYAFLSLVVLYFIPCAPKATRSTWWYARHILKYNRRKSACLLVRNYYRLGQILIDKVAIGCGREQQYNFSFGEEYSKFLDLLNQQQGVIMIGAHVGNWEIGASFFKDYGKKMNIVMFDAEYQKIKKILEENTDTKNYKVIPVNEGDLTALFKIKDALDRQEHVCFQGDRYVKGSPTLQAPFMGENARFPAGPYTLASRLGVPLILYFATREKGMRYVFHFRIADPVKRNKGIKPEEELLRQYLSSLEAIVKKYPEQWFNYYHFWA